MRERFRPSQTRIKATSKSSGGINAATTDSSVCNTQPTPEFITAEANYQGNKNGYSNADTDPKTVPTTQED